MQVVIIGNGIAGVTTARYIRKTNVKAEITIVSSETDHFFSRTALMYIYMGHMRFQETKPYEDWFWAKNNISLKKAHVTFVNFSKQEIVLNSKESLPYDKLVIATGSKPNMFNWPGQDLTGAHGLYHKQDLEALEGRTPFIKHAAIVGGGLIGVELAEMLLSRGKSVSFIIREKLFWPKVLPKQDALMIQEHMVNDHHVDLQLNKNLGEIIGDAENGVKAIKLEENEEIIPCEFVGLTAGVSPNVAFLKDTDLAIDKGVLVNEFLETNLANVYAVGDCAQLQEPREGRRSIEAVWYVGRMMGECLGKTIGGKKTPYKPGPWFNSAKFFDIEYQTYGIVNAEASENEERFFWKHPHKNIALHVAFRKTDDVLLGVNVYGYRLRHELLDKLLRKRATVDEFMQKLPQANFDPELYRKNEKEIIEAFNKQFSKTIKPTKTSWFSKLKSA